MMKIATSLILIAVTGLRGASAADADVPPSSAQEAENVAETRPSEKKAPKSYSFFEAMGKSIWGDVYAHPEDWQELSYSDFFSKGWDQPWVSPPEGPGGAPRQGWLLAFEGVFYRLGIGVFGWQHQLAGQGDGYSATMVNFTPINQRLNIQTDIPMVSNDLRHDGDRQTNIGDFKIQPRFLLSESESLTQTLNISFRTPTGNPVNGAGWASVAPQYQFWSNPWKGLVVRGGTGFTVPYAGDIQKSGTRTTYDGNLAIGYYLTPHNYAPLIGDLVGYVATNLTQVIDNRGPSSRTFVSIGPGFRSHVADNWYLLGAVEVPVTYPQPYDYQVLGGIMKVY
ncbi:MAG: hypothetical protein EBQ73_11770 [Gammaproteobacteria bacterium]|nr:hypothetical protein [Gammaproteobacteria bacterium]